VERAVLEHGRLRDTVKETVAPVTNHRPIRLLRQTVAKAWGDRVWGLSAEAAFWQLLSIPPLFLALLGSLGYISGLFGRETVNSVRTQLISSFRHVLTPNVVGLIEPTVNDVLSRGRADVISIGFLLSLWAGSSAMATFVNTITIAYDMRDMRGAVRSRLIALWLYVVTMIVSIILLPTLVLGPAKIVSLFPDSLHGDVTTLVHDLYWPVVGLLLLCGLASLYHLAVPIRRPWHRGLPGAVLAGCIFLLGSYLLRIYIDFVVRHAYSYGALAAPIAALLFLFILALAILLGAEFNATLESVWPAKLTRRQRRRAARALTGTEQRPMLPKAAEPPAVPGDETRPAGPQQPGDLTSAAPKPAAPRTAAPKPAAAKAALPKPATRRIDQRPIPEADPSEHGAQAPPPGKDS
jgi:membrane protein